MWMGSARKTQTNLERLQCECRFRHGWVWQESQRSFRDQAISAANISQWCQQSVGFNFAKCIAKPAAAPDTNDQQFDWLLWNKSYCWPEKVHLLSDWCEQVEIFFCLFCMNFWCSGLVYWYRTFWLFMFIWFSPPHFSFAFICTDSFLAQQFRCWKHFGNNHRRSSIKWTFCQSISWTLASTLMANCTAPGWSTIVK